MEKGQRLVEKGSYHANAGIEKARRRKRLYGITYRGKRQNVALLELAKEKGESWRLLKKSSKGMKREASIVEGLTP